MSKKQKTPVQVEKEIHAELDRIHKAITKLNQLRRSFKRLDDEASREALDRLDVENIRSNVCYSTYVYVYHGKPSRKRNRRRPPARETADNRAQLAREVIPHTFSMLKAIWDCAATMSPDPEWPAEIDAGEKPEGRE